MSVNKILSSLSTVSLYMRFCSSSFILSFSIKNDNFWRLWLSYHPSRHPLSGRHCADHTSTGTLWFYERIVRHSNTHWVTWNNLWKQDFATICKTPLHCLCGFTLKLLWPWKRNYWCQRVFNFTNKLGMGNIARVPEKHLFLLYWLCQSLWLCGSQ